MNNRLQKILMAALVLTINAGILTWAADHEDVQNRHSGRKEFKRASDTEEFDLRVGRESAGLSLVLNARLTEGVLRARVFDPAGITTDGFELTNDKPGRPAHGKFTPQLKFAAGTWKLRVERRDASGEYDFQFTAR